MSVCLSIFLSVYLYLCLSVCLSISISVCLSVFLYLCQSVWLSISMYVCLSFYKYVCLSVYLSISMSFCLSIYIYVSQSVCLSVWRNTYIIYIYNKNVRGISEYSWSSSASSSTSSSTFSFSLLFIALVHWFRFLFSPRAHPQRCGRRCASPRATDSTSSVFYIILYLMLLPPLLPPPLPFSCSNFFFPLRLLSEILNLSQWHRQIGASVNGTQCEGLARWLHKTKRFNMHESDAYWIPQGWCELDTPLPSWLLRPCAATTISRLIRQPGPGPDPPSGYPSAWLQWDDASS